MPRDHDTIQREIEQARDALADTMDQLSVKASPKRAIETAKSSLRSKLEDPKVRAALIGVGAVIGIVVLRKLIR